MKPRPISITIIGCLFLLVGLGSLASHTRTFVLAMQILALSAGRAKEIQDFALAAVSATCAGLSGWFILRGHNWARWLSVAWMVFHIGISILHSTEQLLTHVVLFTPILFFLFRKPGANYFSES